MKTPLKNLTLSTQDGALADSLSQSAGYKLIHEESSVKIFKRGEK